jgi:hypothetical protein
MAVTMALKWNIGSGVHTTSQAVRRQQMPDLAGQQLVVAVAEHAALDGPVVPPVYTNVATGRGPHAGRPRHRGPASRSSQPWTVAPARGVGAPPTTTRW